MKINPRLFRLDSNRLGQLAITVLIMVGLRNVELFGQDWPQINGPSRNGVAVGETLLDQWPTSGPQKIWTHPVGQGFAGPVVMGNQLIVFHRPTNNYWVESLAADTGKLNWKIELPSQYQGGGPDQDNGPKAAPLIHRDRVYLYGTGGNLFCLSLIDGEIVWQKDLREIYKSPTGYFGFGSSPIVIDERLLVNVGGREAGVVAFDLTTGNELWRTFDDRASYSSPIAAEINGQTTAVFVTRMHLIGLNPETGESLFKDDFGKRGPTVNGAMPLFVDDHLFVNAAYGIGARWINTTGGKLKTVWANDESFSSQYSTPIFLNGYLYGTAGREDFRDGSFRCVEAKTGKVEWVKNNFPVGHTFFVGGQLLTLDSEGTLHQIVPTIKEYSPVQAAKILDGGSRSMPAISNGRLFARTNAQNTRGALSCFQIGKNRQQE